MTDLDERTREQIKRDMESIGIQAGDRDIDDAVTRVAAQKALDAQLAELREHLVLHHYTMSGLHLFGLETLTEIHRTAREQGSHLDITSHSHG